MNKVIRELEERLTRLVERLYDPEADLKAIQNELIITRKLIELNTLFSRVKTWEDFQEFQTTVKDSWDNSLSFYPSFYSRRRPSVEAYDFTHLYGDSGIHSRYWRFNEGFRNTVHYLYNDAKNTGMCSVEKLHRVLFIK